MSESDNPYRAPESECAVVPPLASARRWWYYVAAHGVATIINCVGSYVYIIKANGVWRPPQPAEQLLEGALVATPPLLLVALPVAGYLLNRASQFPKLYLRVFLTDLAIGAVQIFAFLFPAVAT